MILRVVATVLFCAAVFAASASPPRTIAESQELEKPALFNLFNLELGAGGAITDQGRLEPGKWHKLAVEWDVGEQRAEVSLNGRPLTSLRLGRESPGACYLRLRSTAPETDDAGLTVESVEVEIAR